MHHKADLLKAMQREMELRADYLQGQVVETIYFGGGTPSLLSGDELKKMMETIQRLYTLVPNAEVTLEANPDDLTTQKLSELQGTGINRLSIGIQSFRDDDLKWMNRTHNAQQSDYSVKASQDKGFENITVDLIYSIPTLNLDAWRQNLSRTFSLRVQHISAYSLTIEPKTYFGAQQKKGLLKEMAQEESSEQFLMMLDEMLTHDFEQYEVSNFCRPGFESKHNSSYWKGAHYLGVGPSAHSFDGMSRQWNVANNALYTRELTNDKLPAEREVLTEEMRYNEYIMTGLRTKWGIDVKQMEERFGISFLTENAERMDELQSTNHLLIKENIIRLTREGLLKADAIASDFFKV